MPLEILAPLVAAGIALTVFLVWWLADAPPRLLRDTQSAGDLLRTDYPEARISHTILASDGRAALMSLETPADRIGLVSVFGSHHVTRLLGHEDIQTASTDGNRLKLSLADFTCPSIGIELSEAAAGEALAMVRKVMGGNEQQSAGPAMPAKEVDA